MSLTERLQWILDHRDISASALSLQAGQSRAYVRKLMEREPTRPDFTALERIAAVARVPSMWLIRGQGAPEEGPDRLPPDLRLEREDHRVPEENETRAETALFRAMNPDLYTPADFDAARAALIAGPRSEIPDGDLQATATRFLDTARRLRVMGTPATPTNILWHVAVGRHQRGAELAEELAGAEDAEADAELRAHGHEPGQGREVVEERVKAMGAKSGRR